MIGPYPGTKNKIGSSIKPKNCCQNIFEDTYIARERGGTGAGSIPGKIGCLCLCDALMCQVVAYSDSLGFTLVSQMVTPPIQLVNPM